MWKKIVGGVLGILIVVVGSAFGYLSLRQPSSRPAPAIKVAMTPESIARGQYIYNLADCDGCHSPANEKVLYRPVVETARASGQYLDIEGLPGKIYASNLTPDPETGLGKWTDGEKLRAIREGISRDGHAMFPMMPYQNYRHMSDADAQALVAFLNSLKPVRNAVPKTEVSFPVNLLMKGAPRPADEPVRPVSRANTVEYGEYLATVGGCIQCHTIEDKGEPDLTRKFAGGMKFRLRPLNVAVVSANITPDTETGIGKWTLDYFLERFRRHRGVPVESLPAMTPELFTLMPWRNLAKLPDEDLAAIYQYLRTIPPVTNKVVTHPVPLASAE